MKKTAVLTTLALAFGASTASADYVIYKDEAYPSVLFVEIEGGETVEPTVISAPAAPGSADPALAPVDGQEGETADAEGGESSEQEASTDAGDGSADEQSADADNEPSLEERILDAARPTTAEERVIEVVTEEVLEQAVDEGVLDEAVLR
ncbi:MAG: hypothetical protein AAFP99_09380 [Pseudomonadota bacterium]